MPDIEDSLWVGSDTERVLTPAEARIAMGGLLAPRGIIANAVRTGVLYAGQPTLLVGTADTSPMRVSVRPFQAATSKADLNGPYVGGNGSTRTVDVTAAPAAGQSRIDVVYVIQREAAPLSGSADATTKAELLIATGTPAAANPVKPSIPAGAEEIGTVTVAAGATSTNSAQVTLATTCRWTALRGTPVPVRNTTERGVLTGFTGLMVRRLDLKGLVETWDGTGWAGAWQPYTPSLINVPTSAALNIGSGSLTGSYCDTGLTRQIHIEFIRASDTNQGTGAWAFTLPAGTYASYRLSGSGWYQDASPFAEGQLTAKGNAPGTAVAVTTSGARVGTGSPITWAANDEVVLDITAQMVP